MAIHNLLKHKKRRKSLRNNPTRAENILWRYIKGSQLGYKFRRQQSIKQYIVDFYCPKLNLIIELDGEVHNYILQNQKDWTREKNLEKLGFTIIRYKNEDVILNMADILDNLKEICDNLNNT